MSNLTKQSLNKVQFCLYAKFLQKTLNLFPYSVIYSDFWEQNLKWSKLDNATIVL